MKYDRSIRMYDEGYTPEQLDALEGHIHSAKFLNDRFHYSQYLQMKTIFDLSVKSVLEIGPGEGFVASYMRSLNIIYDTLDNTGNPTILSDLMDWKPVKENWDIVAAFQVLEHLPFSLFEECMVKLIAATKKYIIISLPYHCFGLRFKAFLSFGQMKRYKSDIEFHLPTLFKNRKYRKEYMDEFPFAVHHWELGRRPFYTSKIENIFAINSLKIIDKFHSENPYHYFYLLEKK